MNNISINHFTFLHLIDKNDKTIKLDSYLNDAKLEITDELKTSGKIKNGKIRFSQSGGTWQFYLPEEEKRARYDMAIQFARNPRAAKILAMDLQIVTNEMGELHCVIEIKKHENGAETAQTLKTMGKVFADPMAPELANIINPIMDYISIIEPRLEKAGAKYRDMDLDADFWTLTNEIKSAIESIYNFLAEKILNDQYAAPPIPHARPVNLSTLKNIKTEQLKTATDPNLIPDKNGIIRADIKQNIWTGKDKKTGRDLRVKTSGKLTIKRMPPQELDPQDVLLFDLPVKNASNNVTKYHGKVFKGVCTVIDAYRHQHPEIEIKNGFCEIPMTNQQIYTAMGFGNRRLKEETNDDINRAMANIAMTMVWQEWNEEIKARHVDIKKAVDLFGNEIFYNETAQYMLNASPAKIIPNNARTDKNGEKITVDGWIIHRIPPFYAQAKATNQLIPLPIDWFNLKCFKRLTDQRNSLIQVLGERIQMMKRAAKLGLGNDSNYTVINIDNLFKEAGIVCDDRREKEKRKKDVEKILIAFRDEKNIIQNFEYLPKTGHVKSIKITP